MLHHVWCVSPFTSKYPQTLIAHSSARVCLPSEVKSTVWMVVSSWANYKLTAEEAGRCGAACPSSVQTDCHPMEPVLWTELGLMGQIGGVSIRTRAEYGNNKRGVWVRRVSDPEEAWLRCGSPPEPLLDSFTFFWGFVLDCLRTTCS